MFFLLLSTVFDLKAYPQVGQPFLKSSSLPVNPHDGQRILAKKRPQCGHIFVFRFTSFPQYSQKNFGWSFVIFAYLQPLHPAHDLPEHFDFGVSVLAPVLSLSVFVSLV